MKILYDEQIFCNQRFGGISRYYAELARNLNQVEGVNAHILLPFCTNYYASLLPYSCRYGVPVPRIPGTKRMMGFLNRKTSRRLTDALRPDILHQTYFPVVKRRFRKGIKVVTTVYDMIHELFPDEFPAIDLTAKFKRSAVHDADFVICISENTRNDLIDITGISRDKTAVVHLGADHFPFQQLLPENHSERPYLLYVGLRGAYKNFNRVLKAFAASERLMKDFDLVCFGGGPLEESEIELMQKLNLSRDRVVMRTGDDTLLRRLFQNAAAFIYPSLYEGFGIPPLEAMSQNCPVISSNVSSMPEVLGNAAEYFQPDDTQALKNAMMKVVYDPARADELRKLGKNKVGELTWERCAKNTLDVYRKVSSL